MAGPVRSVQQWRADIREVHATVLEKKELGLREYLSHMPPDNQHTSPHRIHGDTPITDRMTPSHSEGRGWADTN